MELLEAFFFVFFVSHQHGTPESTPKAHGSKVETSAVEWRGAHQEVSGSGGTADSTIGEGSIRGSLVAEKNRMERERGYAYTYLAAKKRTLHRANCTALPCMLRPRVG